jgi:hypothetical protein
MKWSPDSLEYMRPEDPFFNYALWPYKPLTPYEKKLRSANLLFHSFSINRVDERLFDLVELMREAMSMGHSVWGIKKVGNQTRWEFYFYDYRRRQRQRSFSRLLEGIRPLVSCGLVPQEDLFYFMFSLDINNELLSPEKGLQEAHMYIGNPGSSVSSGISYSMTTQGMRLENFYFFFDAQRQMEEIIGKVVCSAHIGVKKIDINRIILPELAACRTICIANKQQNDCIYFAGINLDAFLFFLKDFGYDKELIFFVEENRGRLDHLEYDVGFDYRMDGDKVVILKSGYYGTF